jgi:hypothetical protein
MNVVKQKRGTEQRAFSSLLSFHLLVLYLVVGRLRAHSSHPPLAEKVMDPMQVHVESNVDKIESTDEQGKEIVAKFVSFSFYFVSFFSSSYSSVDFHFLVL